MFDKIFVSPQVKRIVIISNKHGIYELPHELSNDLHFRKLGNIKKISILHRIIARRSAQPPNNTKPPQGAIPQKNYSLPEIFWPGL